MKPRHPNRLRVWRAERDMTQTILEQRTGINQSKLSEIENGHVVPTALERQKIARVLRVDVALVFPGWD